MPLHEDRDSFGHQEFARRMMENMNKHDKPSIADSIPTKEYDPQGDLEKALQDHKERLKSLKEGK